MRVYTEAQRQRQQETIDRAYGRARQQAEAGNVPTLTECSFDGQAIRETWIVASRSQRGRYAVSLVHDRISIVTECSCPAPGICWHRAAARLAHTDQITSANTTGIRIRPRTH